MILTKIDERKPVKYSVKQNSIIIPKVFAVDNELHLHDSKLIVYRAMIEGKDSLIVQVKNNQSNK